MKISYIYAKIIKKFLRGNAIRNSKIDVSTKVNSGCSIYNCSIGRYNNIGYDNELCDVEIGSFCSFSDHVFIGGAEHPLDWVSTSPVFENVKNSGPKYKFSSFDVPIHKKTIISNDVWIGHNACVKAGVFIGTGAVIGTGSVVTKDVQPYAIVAGVPAKIIRYRFDEITIKQLLESQWWCLPEKDLLIIGKYIREPHKFLTIVDKLKSDRQFFKKK